MYTWLGLHFIYKILGLLCWLGAILTYKPQTEEKNQNVSAVTVTPVRHGKSPLYPKRPKIGYKIIKFRKKINFELILIGYF